MGGIRLFNLKSVDVWHQRFFYLGDCFDFSKINAVEVLVGWGEYLKYD